MQRLRSQRGDALILLIGITAALAVLAATAVMVTANTQRATADTRAHATALNYAEAALNSGVLAVRTQTWPVANGSFGATDLASAYNATYTPAGPNPSGPQTNYVQVYDNQNPVNKSITWDKGSPTSATTPDGKLWVEASVTYNGQTARVRELVGQVNTTGSFLVPAAAIYTDGNVKFTSGGGDAFGVKADGSADTGKTAAIMAGGKFVGNWSTDLSPNGGAATLSVLTNGTVYNPKLGITTAVAGTGGVAPLSTKMTPANVATITAQAQQGTPTQANASGTVVSAALLSQLQASSPQTYNAATDLVVNGNLTLGGGTSYFNFRSLYVTGNLTLTGNTFTNTTALYVGGNFTISGPSGTSQFGPIYVGGNVNWGGAINVKTTNYTDTTAAPGPMYIGGSFTNAGGPFTDVFGNTYVAGAVTFSGNNANIQCPVLVTPSQVTTSGSGNFGTVAQPMLLMGLPVTPALAMNFGAHGTFTGLLVNMGGGVNLNNDGTAQLPNNYSFFIDGAVMATGDVDFNNNGNVGYNPSALANLHITAGTTTTSVVTGTWQQLSPSGQ